MGMTPFELAQTPALEIDHVSHRYGARVALNDVSLTVRQSSFTVLLGLNGAGKSTLFSLITRLYAIRSGQIRIFGHDVGSEPGAALSAPAESTEKAAIWDAAPLGTDAKM